MGFNSGFKGLTYACIYEKNIFETYISEYSALDRNIACRYGKLIKILNFYSYRKFYLPFSLLFALVAVQYAPP